MMYYKDSLVCTFVRVCVNLLCSNLLLILVLHKHNLIEQWKLPLTKEQQV